MPKLTTKKRTLKGYSLSKYFLLPVLMKVKIKKTIFTLSHVENSNFFVSFGFWSSQKY